MRCSLLIFSILLLFSCRKESKNTQSIAIGHAAMGLEMSNAIFHDNSKEAIDLALNYYQIDGVELDVQMSADGDLWLYHDVNLASSTDGQSCVNNLNSSVLNSIRYSSFHRESLLQLDSLLIDRFGSKQIFLDLRHFNNCKEQKVSFPNFFNALESLHLEDHLNIHCIVSDPSLLEYLENDFSIYFATDNYEEGVHLLQNHPNILGLVIRNKMVTEQEIKALQLLGKKSMVFDLRSPASIKNALSKNPDFILSDDIPVALSLMH